MKAKTTKTAKSTNTAKSTKVAKITKAAELRDFALAALADLKGQDPVSLDIRKLSTIADYMLVVTGTSTRHVKSLADELVKRCKEKGTPVRGQEGGQQAEWVLIDLGDVIVHVMQGSVRKLYDLETLWSMTPEKK